MTGLVALAPPAQAATKYGTAMVKTQRMSDATLKSKQYGWYAKGARLKLTCYKRGQSVRGYYTPWAGWSNVWYKISDGRYVADIDISTGSNKPVTTACSKPKPKPAPSSLSKRVDAFVKKWKGKQVNLYSAPDNPGQCYALFNQYNRDVIRAKRALGSAAYKIYDTYDRAKYSRLGAKAAPRKGDVAVWASSIPGSQGHGHVSIVLGASGSKLVVLQQNYAGRQYVTQDTVAKSYLRGYLRPKS